MWRATVLSSSWTCALPAQTELWEAKDEVLGVWQHVAEDRAILDRWSASRKLGISPRTAALPANRSIVGLATSVGELPSVQVMLRQTYRRCVAKLLNALKLFQ
jgi:hypothetical protein